VRRVFLALAAIVAATAFIAGCGSSSQSSSPTSSAGVSSQAASSATASSGSAAPASASAVAITTKHDKLGTILAVGSKELTVYLFEADKGSASACSGACAKAWPPVIGTPKAIGGAHASDLGTIMRADGQTQVTYKGHPLYTYVRDEDDGDAYGQASKQFGAEWYVLAPSGSKVDNS
jgi:predicted lipoprotein with Yx(FWY)xxD motif